MGQLFRRQPFEFPVSRTVGPNELARVSLPTLGGGQAQGTITPPPPETRTETVRGSTAPPALLALADALTAFGAGVPAAQAQQQQRLQTLRSLRRRFDEQSVREGVLAQQKFENLRSLRKDEFQQAQLQLAQSREQRQAEQQRIQNILSGISVSTDSAGRVTFVNKLGLLPSILSKGFVTEDDISNNVIQLDREQDDLDVAVADAAARFGINLSSLDPEQVAAFRASVEESVKTGKSGPIRQTLTSFATQRQIAERAFIGSLTPLVDQEGNIKGVFNNKTGQISNIRTPSDLRKSEIGSEKLKTRENASSGLRALATIEEELSKNQFALAQESLPFAPGARVLRTAKKEAADVITRLRTGAAINANEEAFYKGQLPGPLDSQETIEFKINLLREFYKSLGGREPGGFGSGSLDPTK